MLPSGVIPEDFRKALGHFSKNNFSKAICNETGGNESMGYGRSRSSVLVLSQTLGEKKSTLMASFWKAQESQQQY